MDLYSIIKPYADRADAASDVLQKTHGWTAEQVGELRETINYHVEAVHRELLAAMGEVESSESWDEVEFDEGRIAAEAYAREKGISDETLLGAIRQFGYHHAALKLQLSIHQTPGRSSEDDFDEIRALDL